MPIDSIIHQMFLTYILLMNQIKPIIQQLSNARQGINQQKNISENVERMKQAFDQLKPAIKEQLDYITNMNPQKVNESANSDLMNQKRYFLRFLDIIMRDLADMVEAAKGMLLVKDRNMKSDAIWEKILYSQDKYIRGIKDSLTPETNYMDVIFRLLNYRDNFFMQLLQGIIHRKVLLWKDLNLQNEPFIHNQLKVLITQVEQKVLKGQILSEKLEFKQYDWESDLNGVWKYQQYSENQLPLSLYITLLNETFDDLAMVVRRQANLNNAKPMPSNEKQVMSLRATIEELSNENEKLNNSLNQMKFQKRSNEFEEIKRLQGIIEDLELTLSRKEREVNELMTNSKGSLSVISNLRDKLKETEEENHRFTNQFFPKQRELEGQQLKLLDEFQKIKKDIDTYSQLFKMESQIRQKALLQKDQSDDQVQKLVDMLGKQKQKNKSQQDVIKQKDSIIYKVLESKRELVQQIASLSESITTLQKSIEVDQQRILDLQESVEQSDRKYQDMFEINTHFNKRIYELERQKKELLDLLKQHDIEPDPTKLNFNE